MRTFFGMILGVFLTIGAAYLYDATVTGQTTPTDTAVTAGPKPMVNWDVVSGTWHRFTVAVHSGWKKLETTKI